jgi:pimeloyl-ACP methyl ester carboxylesterase
MYTLSRAGHGGSDQECAVGEYWFNSHDGLRLFSRVYSGPRAGAPVVLCLHGLMRNSRDFGDLAGHLAALYRVIVPDIRGRGLSDRDPNFNNYTIPVYLQDVATLLAGLGVARCSIVGTSMGGLLAMVLAATQPALVARIVLNDVGPEVDPAGLARIRGYAGKTAPVKSWAEAIAQTRTLYGAAWPGLPDSRWEEIARLNYRANAQGIPEVDADPLISEPLKDTRAVAPDLWPLWKSLGAPILAIRGASSDILSASTLERMQREKPGLQTLTVANRGHTPLLDEPECVAAIDEFLAAGA